MRRNSKWRNSKRRNSKMEMRRRRIEKKKLAKMPLLEFSRQVVEVAFKALSTPKVTYHRPR